MVMKRAKHRPKGRKPLSLLMRSLKVLGTSVETTNKVRVRAKTASLKASRRLVSVPRRRNAKDCVAEGALDDGCVNATLLTSRMTVTSGYGEPPGGAHGPTIWRRISGVLLCRVYWSPLVLSTPLR